MFKILVFLIFSQGVFAQEDHGELAKKLANPVSSLISIPMQNNVDFGIGDFKGTSYSLNLQPVIPFSIGEKFNFITRWIVPIMSQYNTSGYGESKSGLGDAVITGFLSPKESKNGLTWGAGPVMLLPIGSDGLSIEQLGIGPSLVVLKQSGGLTYGGLVNQIWGTGGKNKINFSQFYINPFMAYNWKSGAGITAQLDWTHNWETSKSNIYFIPMFSGLTSFGKQKVSLSLGPRFNIIAPEGAKTKMGIRAGISLIFPK